MKKILFLFSLTVLLFSCNSKTENHKINDKPIKIETPKYAKGFNIEYYENYKVLNIFNPWEKGNIQEKIYITSEKNLTFPKNNVVIITPIENIAISSCTHIEFINLLDSVNIIKGVCSPELIYNSTIQKLYKEKKITNLGDAFNINIELLLNLNPQGLMLSTYNKQDNNTKRLEQSGIQLLYNNEWTESTLLGRAEWIKYFGILLDKKEKADSIFNHIEANYLLAQKLAKSITNKKSVMVGSNFKGTWYVPGGQSYMGQLLQDSGADYYYSNTSETQSIPLNFETVLDKFHNADVWLNAPTSTIQELFEIDSRHKLFNSAIKGEVYAFLARTNSYGANDFWESGIAHPDLLLKDIIWALYPELLTEYIPTYILKLK